MNKCCQIIIGDKSVKSNIKIIAAWIPASLIPVWNSELIERDRSGTGVEKAEKLGEQSTVVSESRKKEQSGGHRAETERWVEITKIGLMQSGKTGLLCSAQMLS